MVSSNEWRELTEIIKSKKNIAICSHISPDGDNIGSIIALKEGLKQLGIEAKVWKVDTVPKNLRFLQGVSEMITPELPVDILIVVDCSDERRLGLYSSYVDKIPIVVNIDHHKSNNYFGTYNYVNPNAAAAGELIFDFLKEAGIKWTDEIASGLYTAISSDTGSFMYDTTSVSTHMRAAELLGAIKDKNLITEKLYQSRTLVQTKLMNSVVSKMKLHLEIQSVFASVSYEELLDLNAEPDDTEGIVTFLNEIEEIKISVFFKEKEKGHIRVSVRSKGDYDVSAICEAFGGGGHKKAAGTSFNGTIQEAENAFYKKIGELYFL